MLSDFHVAVYDGHEKTGIHVHAVRVVVDDILPFNFHRSVVVPQIRKLSG